MVVVAQLAQLVVDGLQFDIVINIIVVIVVTAGAAVVGEHLLVVQNNVRSKYVLYELVVED